MHQTRLDERVNFGLGLRAGSHMDYSCRSGTG